MSNPTDTNQASEDELREHLIKKLNTKKRMIEPYDERFVIGFQTEAPGDDVDWQYLDEVIMRFVNDFIRTEKLKLLAEVKSSLTQLKELKENRDDKGVLWGSYDVVDLDDIREVLTELEAEL